MRHLPMRAALFATLLLSFHCLASAQTPQQAPPNPAAERLSVLLELLAVEMQAQTYALNPEKFKDNADAPRRLAELYAKVAADPELTAALLGRKFGDYLELRQGARSAPQVSQAAAEGGMNLQLLGAAQNSVIIEQNKRIISLLEQLVKKR